MRVFRLFLIFLCLQSLLYIDFGDFAQLQTVSALLEILSHEQ